MDVTPDEDAAGLVQEQVIAGLPRHEVERSVVARGYTQEQAAELYDEVAAHAQDQGNRRRAWEGEGGSP